LIVDLHSDLLLDVLDRRVAGERNVLARRHLPELVEAGVRIQVLAAYTPTQLLPEGALRHAVSLLDAAWRDAEESDGAWRIVASRSELEEALEDGALATILALEGAEALGRQPELAATFARLGVRSIGLTWNRANGFADGATEDRGAGVTARGRRLLEEMAERGIALDISHLTHRAALEAIGHAPGPVFASHSNAASVYANARNIGDELVAAIAARGGVVGINAVPVFLGAGDPVARMVEHGARIAAVGGASVPAVGADLVSFLIDWPAEPSDLQAPEGADPELRDEPEPARAELYPQLRAAVGTAAAGMLGENALAFWRRALP
jgi:membrane dipeptidase